jgi:nitroreductase
MPDNPSRLNIAVPATLDLLLSRRSGSAKTMTGPGPDAGQLHRILSAGVRVPDHGKLIPWRFVLFEGEGRKRAGAILAEAVAKESGVTELRIEQERERFLRAPVVIAVVVRLREQIAIPVWEQELSSGAVCQTILIAAHAMGFVAQWVTEWYAYNPEVMEKFGLKAGERIAGFIYIGTSTVALEDRPRPDVSALTTKF